MRRKLVSIVIGLLALFGVIGAGLTHTSNDTAKQTGELVEGDTRENESSESEDADEPGDVDAPGPADD